MGMLVGAVGGSGCSKNHWSRGEKHASARASVGKAGRGEGFEWFLMALLVELK